MRPLAALSAASVVSVLVVGLPGNAGVADGERPPVRADERAPAPQQLLSNAVEASEQDYAGRLSVIGFRDQAPHLAELAISHDADGMLQVGESSSWVLGRDGAAAYYYDASAGRLLELGMEDSMRFHPDNLAPKYRVDVLGLAELTTGEAWVAEVRLTDGGELREVLYADRDRGLIVRRETYGPGGRPERLVAFTELEPRASAREAAFDTQAAPAGPRKALSVRGLEILEGIGWDVPEFLPGGFRLRGSYAIEREGGSSVHLVYSDGLYSMSLFEQMGELDGDAVQDAISDRHGEAHVYRWPGSEPERMVWSADGKTFTAVSDAPYGDIMEAITPLPHEPHPSLLGRLGRGTGRIVSWLWPFG